MTNSLEFWNIYNPLALRGDLLFFDGSDFSDVHESIEHFISNSIEVLTHERWSHVAMIYDDFQLIESTLETGKNGPQLNSIIDRIQNYDGRRIYLYRLKDFVRANLDIDRMLSYGQSKIGKYHYGYKSILDFVVRPLLGWVPGLKKRINIPDNDSVVCSEYVTNMLQVGSNGIVEIDTLNAHKTDPGALAKVPIFKAPIPILERKENERMV